MKRILFFLLLVINLSAFGQVPSGYTQAGWRYKVKAFIFDSTLHIPSYNGTPSGIRTGGWVGDGAIGMDTTNHRMYIYSGGAWLRLAKYSEVTTHTWSLTGNSINAGTDFIGTTNNTSMRFRTNNTVRMVLDSNGNVGIGTTSPTALLHVVDNSVTDGIGFKISSSSLSSGSLVNISATSTAADLSSQRGLNVTLSGANATGGQNTYSGYFSNLHTGAGSNFGIYSEANGGNNNKAIIGTSTSNGGIGINGFVTGASAYAGYFENSGGSGSGTGYGMYVTKTGSATNNIAGYFTASGGTNNYAILVPTSGGKVGIGTSSPDSLLTVELGIRGKRGARFDGLPTFADTTNYKPVVINSSGTLYKATYWPGGGGTPAGSNKELQYNNSGSFGGTTGIEYGNTNNTLKVYSSNASDTNIVIASSSDVALNIRLNFSSPYAQELRWQATSNGFSGGISLGYNGLIIRGKAADAGSWPLVIFANGISNEAVSNFIVNTNGYATNTYMTRTRTSATSSIGNLIDWGNSGQTADMMQFRNNSSTVLSRFNKNGWLGVGADSSRSYIDANGSFGANITTTTSNITLNETHYTVIITGGTPTVTLPLASSATRRMYVIVNQTASALTISSYKDLSGTSQTTVAATSSITIQSDGTNWYRVK